MQHGVAVVVVVVGADVEVPTEKIFLENLFNFSSVFCFLRYNIFFIYRKGWLHFILHHFIDTAC